MAQLLDVEVRYTAHDLESDEEDEFSALLHVRPTTGKISSEYGLRKLGRSRPRQHRGVDIMANRGTPVKASGGGKIVFAGRRGTYGNLIEIRHEGGMVTRYAHLDKIAVKRGQVVTPGAKLGTVGRTGRTTGYNLHFEVIVENKHVDPLSVVGWT